MTEASNLGAEVEGLVDSLVRSGRFRSRADVLSEGVRLVEKRETMRADLDEALARGLADAEAGRVTPLDVVGDRLVARYEAMAKAATANPFPALFT